ncbi:MAG: alpha/beta hydrolase [Xanthobacteraceae bacterium]
MKLVQAFNIALILSVIAPTAGQCAPAQAAEVRRVIEDSEARLRRVIAELTRGAPDLDTMEPPLRRALEPLIAQTAALLQAMGPLQSITSAGAQSGMDLFVATFQSGAVTWGIRLSPSGQIAALFYRPLPAAEIQGDEVKVAGLAGTLLRPNGIERPPVVLLIAGSGPTDRNGNQHGAGPGTLRQIAEQLAGRGIASLRYDKRGVGRSEAKSTREEDVDLESFVEDAAAFMTWLEQRADLGPRYVAGHSEGGLIAMRLAAGRPLAGLVLLATPGRRLGEVMRDQLKAANLPAPLHDEAFSILAALEDGRSVPTVSAPLLSLLRPGVQPLLRSELAMDPANELAALSLPTLVVSGGHDLQVGQQDTAALLRARPDAKRFHAADMNHVLKITPAGRDEQKTAYADARPPLAPGLIDAIAGFMMAQRR